MPIFKFNDKYKKCKIYPRLNGMKEFGLRRSDGERLVRKLCDLAFRILGRCLEW